MSIHPSINPSSEFESKKKSARWPRALLRSGSVESYGWEKEMARYGCACLRSTEGWRACGQLGLYSKVRGSLGNSDCVPNRKNQGRTEF